MAMPSTISTSMMRTYKMMGFISPSFGRRREEVVMNLRHTITIVAAMTFLTCLPVQASVVTDGTVGPGVSLPGPDYQISDTLVTSAGANLFHSFARFDLNSSESATFSGPDSVTNIISRVTGGASTINGQLRSLIPGADLYLLNPAGILFGEQAVLDLQGSFYASTADYLALGDNGRFDTASPTNSLLTSDPPTAFGFLTTEPATISIQDSLLNLEQPGNINLVAGSLQLSDSVDQQILRTAAGDINLVAGGGGEVGVNPGLAEQTLSSRGDLILSGSEVQQSAQLFADGGGRIFISAGRLFGEHAGVMTSTVGDVPGGDILVAAETVSLDGGFLATTSSGMEQAGSIVVDSASIEVVNGHFAISYSEGGGDSGSIRLNGENNVLIGLGSFLYTDASDL
ncbi:MAG: hypothetical protein C0614_00170, partial [Desulfuromonas sp.]